MDSPTGDRHNSPVVCIKYPSNNQPTATMPSLLACCAPPERRESQAELQEPEGEFHRGARLQAACGERGSTER